MGYVDDGLITNEHVIYRTSLHWVIFVAPTLSSLFISAIILIFLLYGASGIAFWMFFGSIFLATIIWLSAALLSFKTSEFGITDQRVLAKFGAIGKDSLEILLTKIEAIQVSQSLIGKVFNYGTIIIIGTGGTSNSFNMIKNPLECRKQAQEQIAALKQ